MVSVAYNHSAQAASAQAAFNQRHTNIAVFIKTHKHTHTHTPAPE